MKGICLALGAIVLLHFVYGELTPEEQDAECKKKSGFKGALPDIKNDGASKEAKCYLSCLMTAKGVQKADGSFDRDKAKEVITTEYANWKGPMEKQFSVIEKCSDKIKTGSKDLCEDAYNYVVCKRNIIGIQALDS